MALEHWIPTNEEKRAGGQGFVLKVRHRDDGRIGALKQLHGDSSKRTERRYRFLTEVSGLRALEEPGIPGVFDSNEERWKEKDTELFLVMEFIDGPTLSELVQKRRPTVDQALLATRRLLQTLAAGHRLPLHHRDLKPDNIILRDGQWDTPVIVDMGMAWHATHIEAEFATPSGIEIGNRFLRLPEFAPGGEHRDARSDLAMVAGLLFFMLSGRAPRVLVDHDGRHPHEVEPSPIPADVVGDHRWQKIKGLLHVAFQQRIDARFQTADEFLRRLNDVEERPTMDSDDLEAEIARLKELTSSAVARERVEAADSMIEANANLCSELDKVWRDAGLQWGGQNPVMKNNGASNEFYCVVSKSGHTEPNVVFLHKIELFEGRLRASWTIDKSPPVFGVECSAADSEKLKEATSAATRKIAAAVIRHLNIKLTPPPSLAPFLSD